MGVSQTNRLVFLDSLRGLAASIVVFHHVFVFHLKWFANTIGEDSFLFRLSAFISDLNHDAVLFFFVLSGFVIRLSTNKLDLTKKHDLNYYLYKRFRRILPLYWITLAVTLILGLFHGHPQLEESYGLLTLFGNLLFLQTSDQVGSYWVASYGENGPLWSLAYEMFFYLFLPLFLIFLVTLARKLRMQLESWHLLFAAFLFSLGAIGLRALFFTPFFSFLALFPIWVAGYYLGAIYLENERKDREMALLTLGVIGLSLFSSRFHSDTLDVIAKSWYLIVVPGYLYYRFREKLRPSLNTFQKGFNWLFYQIGEGSYAIYLMHYPLIILLQAIPGLPFALRMALLAGWCFLLVHLETGVNKRPFLFFKRRYV